MYDFAKSYGSCMFFIADDGQIVVPENISYEEYKKMTDKQHLSKAKTMPIKVLKMKNGC